MAGGYPCCCDELGSGSSPLGSSGSSPDLGLYCASCAGGVAPAQLQLELQGVAPGTALFGCTNEEIWNATWVLDGLDGACLWYHVISPDDLIRCNPLNIYLFLGTAAGHYVLDLDCSATDSVFLGVQTRHALARIDLGPSVPDCLTALDGLVFSGFSGALTPLHYDFAAATATLTVI